MNIQNKILIGIISVLIFAIGINTFFFIQSTKTIHHKISDNLTLLSEGFSDKLDRKFIYYKKALKSLSSTILSVLNVEVFLNKQQKLHPDFKQLFYTTLQGQVISQYPLTEEKLSFNFSNKNYWKEVFDKQSINISSVNSDFGYPAIVISSPVFVEYGEGILKELQGIVCVTIPLSKIFDFIHDLPRDSKISPFVINQSGLLLSHQNPSYILKKRLSQTDNHPTLKKIEYNMTQLKNNKVGWSTYKHKGTRYFIAFSAIRSQKWTLGIKGHLEDFTQDVESLSQTTFTILIISIILATIIIYTLIKKLVTTPVLILKNAMQDVKDGLIGRKINIESRDEMGDLALSFNFMSESLEHYHKEIQESEERFRRLAETTPEGILVHEKGEIIDGNQTIGEMLDYDLEELIGHSVLDIIHHSSHELVKGIIHSTSPQIYETTIVKKTGEKIPVEISSKSALFHGRIIRIATIRDISERKKIELLRESVERIARHDLKNPLNAILGFSHLLSKQKLNTKQKKYVGLIRENGFHMLYMIDHSFDLFRMEQGTYKFKPIKIDLIRIFKKLAEEFAHYFKKHPVQIQINLNEELVVWNQTLFFDGEPSHIERLFSNLLKNAVEASYNGKIVSISINECKNAGTESIAVDIHNFTPIPEKIRDRFFERYITSGKEGGTGLGTYSALLIARTHGGNIRFTTSEEEGTHIITELPKFHHKLDIELQH